MNYSTYSVYTSVKQYGAKIDVPGKPTCNDPFCFAYITFHSRKIEPRNFREEITRFVGWAIGFKAIILTFYDTFILLYCDEIDSALSRLN